MIQKKNRYFIPKPAKVSFRNLGKDIDEYKVKPFLCGHSKIDETKILITNGSLMQVKSIAFCNTFDLH